jgi:hypothetical protein
MARKRGVWLAAAVLLAAAWLGKAAGGDHHHVWEGGGATASWMDPGNWANESVPADNATVTISSSAAEAAGGAGIMLVPSGVDISVWSLRIEGTGSVVDVEGGLIVAGGGLWIGEGANLRVLRGNATIQGGSSFVGGRVYALGSKLAGHPGGRVLSVIGGARLEVQGEFESKNCTVHIAGIANISGGLTAWSTSLQLQVGAVVSLSGHAALREGSAVQLAEDAVLEVGSNTTLLLLASADAETASSATGDGVLSLRGEIEVGPGAGGWRIEARVDSIGGKVRGFTPSSLGTPQMQTCISRRTGNLQPSSHSSPPGRGASPRAPLAWQGRG